MIEQTFAPHLAPPVNFFLRRDVHQIVLVALSIIFAAGVMLYMLNPFLSPIKLAVLCGSGGGILAVLTLMTIKSTLYPLAEKIAIYAQPSLKTNIYSEEIVEIFYSTENIKKLPRYHTQVDIRQRNVDKKLLEAMTDTPLLRGVQPTGSEFIAIRYARGGVKEDSQEMGLLLLVQKEDWTMSGNIEWIAIDKSNLLRFNIVENLKTPKIKNFLKILFKEGQAPCFPLRGHSESDCIVYFKNHLHD